MRRETRIKQVKAISSGIEAIQRVCPILDAPATVIAGLSEILDATSPVIAPGAQRQLKGVLSKNILKYYYVSIKGGFKIPYYLRHVYYKNELTARDPNTIQVLNLEGYKFFAYCVKFLDYDGNGFYFIIHEKDIVRFLLAVREANELTQYDIESREHDFETIDDICGAKDIEHTFEYTKIFTYMDEYERKMFFIYCKKAGLTKENRTIVKKLLAPCMSFECRLEEMEHAINRIKDEIRENEDEDPLKVMDLEKDLKQLEKLFLKLQEEDNSWNDIKTDLEDYWYL